MGTVNIIIQHNQNHPAATYVLLKSLIETRYVETNYHIWISTGCDHGERTELLRLQPEKIQIEIVTEEELKKLPVKKAIVLQWNTIVVDDLSFLYEMDLGDKVIGAAANIPEHIYRIPESASKFNDAVILLDCTTPDYWQKVQDLPSRAVKELPVFCNLAYDLLLINRKLYKTEVLQNATRMEKVELKELRKKALVLRYEETYSPEQYFDHPYADLWLKYLYDFKYQKTGGLISSTETLGTVPEVDGQMIPISFFLKNEEISYADQLIQTLENNSSVEEKLDIRILYTVLSEKNKKTLLQMKSEKTKIVLYNVERALMDAPFGNPLTLLPKIFANYQKAIWINVRIVEIGNLADLYNCSMGEIYFRAAVSRNEENFESIPDTSLMLINMKKWIQDHVTEAISNEEETEKDFSEALYAVCKRAIGKLPDEFQQVKMSADKEKEEEKVKDIIERLEVAERQNADLSIEMDNLRKQIEDLRQQNEVLNQERGQFLYELLETRKSFTYKVGRFITFLPRKLRSKR